MNGSRATEMAPSAELAAELAGIQQQLTEAAELALTVKKHQL